VTALRLFMAAWAPEVTALPSAVSALRPDGATFLRAVSECVYRKRKVAARRLPHVRAEG
jgi:hypothetical protein